MNTCIGGVLLLYVLPPDDVESPPPLEVESPPPLDVESPPPLDVESPPPLDVESPPPEDVDNPPPDDVERPPPDEVDIPPPLEVDIPPPLDVDSPPPLDVDRPPPDEVLRLRGHVFRVIASSVHLMRCLPSRDSNCLHRHSCFRWFVTSGRMRSRLCTRRLVARENPVSTLNSL